MIWDVFIGSWDHQHGIFSSAKGKGDLPFVMPYMAKFYWSWWSKWDFAGLCIWVPDMMGWDRLGSALGSGVPAWSLNGWPDREMMTWKGWTEWEAPSRSLSELSWWMHGREGGGADCRQSCEALEHLPGGWQAARPAHHSHILLTHGFQVSAQIFASLCKPQQHFPQI